MNNNFISLLKFLNINNVSVDIYFSEKIKINGIGSIINSDDSHITFFNDIKYKNDLKLTKAKACFIRYEHKDFLPKICFPIIVEDPYIAFALSTNFFYSLNNISSNIPIKDFKNKFKFIGKFVSIKSNTIIQDNVTIYDNVCLGPNVTIGNNTIIKSGSVISNATIGNNCLIQSGSIIGDRGFGFTIDKKIEIYHVGKVIIGNNVQIGSNCTIDQAVLDSTIINDNVRIDNLVHIAHNVYIDKDTIIAAQTGIAGSTKIGKNCIIGGQVGITGHINIGDNVIIAAKSGVTKNIKNNSTIAGFPAIDLKKWKKIMLKQYRDSL